MMSFIICTSNTITEQWYKDVNWINLAQEMVQWSAVVKTILYLWGQAISKSVDHVLPAQQGLCSMGIVIQLFSIHKCMFVSD
jgi:hypothetical protein